MINTENLLAHFRSLSALAQSEVLQTLRVESEEKGKLLDVAQSEITSKKTCPHFFSGCHRNIYKII